MPGSQERTGRRSGRAAICPASRAPVPPPVAAESTAEVIRTASAHERATKRLNDERGGCYKRGRFERREGWYDEGMEIAERAQESFILVSLTESAAAKIKELQAQEPAGEAGVLRVAVQGGG